MKNHSKFTSLLSATALVLSLSSVASAYESTTGPTGVLLYDKEKAYDGYTLISPMIKNKSSYLLNMDGQIVHEWKCKASPGLYAELLPNGHLLRAETTDQKKDIKDSGLNIKGKKYAGIGGSGGYIREYNWDGDMVWEYKMSEANKEIQHHTFNRMPNGNTLILGWEYITKEKAIELGRKPETIPSKPVKNKGGYHNGFWNDFVREVNPKGDTVWEWHVSDHIGTGPDKIDFNYILPKPLGELYHDYDWSHFNTVNYIPETDTIVLNSRNFGEFYFINHKTGKIEYRWGNPTTYDPKAKKPSYYDDGDQIVFGSHCATPIANGNIILFDNGSERPESRRSRALEINPKTGEIVWEFASKHTNSFSSHRQGGVQRLANGNTLICSTHGGHVMEVTPDKEIVWEFVNPITVGKPKCILRNEDGGFNDGMGNMIHRAFRYGTDYPAFEGKDLSQKAELAEECPVFYKVYKKGLSVDGDDDEEEEGATMNAY